MTSKAINRGLHSARGAKRSHAAKKTGLSADQRAEIDAALGVYGARLTDDDRIAKGDKVMSVQVEAKGGRLKMVGGGNVLASYPASRAGQGVSDFVEKFWFWRKDATTAHATKKKSPAQLQREIDEVIAQRRYPTGPLRDAASLHDVWDPSGKRFKLTYLPYHGKNLYPSYSAYGYGSFEEFFADRAEAKARAKQLRDEDRIEKFEIHEIVRPKTGGVALRLVDEWDDSES